MPLRHIIGISLFISGSGLNAQETKTTYSINGSNATVTTIIKKASAEKEKMLKTWLFEAIAEKLKTMPTVANVEYSSDVKGDVSGSTWTDYWEHKRKYPVMVSLALNTPVTLMLRVEETYRTCKSVAEKQANATTPVSYGGDEGGSGLDALVDCSLGSQVKITGPVAVYGNFASSTEIDKLLKEKQTITYDLARDWSDKANLKLEGRFSIESELFDQNLLKFLDGVNSAPLGTQGVVTRNSLLLGIARVLRVQNERMVEK